MYSRILVRLAAPLILTLLFPLSVGFDWPNALQWALLTSLTLAGCQKSQPTNQPQIRVVSEEQKQLHQLDAFNLAIGLKRAIYDAGYSCKRITDAGFVGTWQNLDEWTAHCVYDNGSSRDWAISSRGTPRGLRASRFKTTASYSPKCLRNSATFQNGFATTVD